MPPYLLAYRTQNMTGFTKWCMHADQPSMDFMKCDRTNPFSNKGLIHCHFWYFIQYSAAKDAIPTLEQQKIAEDNY